MLGDDCKEADDWIAREKAKEIVNSKVLEMKEIAKSKAKEEKKKLEAECMCSHLSCTYGLVYVVAISYTTTQVWPLCISLPKN
ncbi:hypothetical protein VNO80_25465 [Phaseolus coccineus]|uniref:Uncharacterized protein n=1 Tax=Phaseolus coccineus TaxID=3886 RepID=A0AAN9LUA9_PHACN